MCWNNSPEVTHYLLNISPSFHGAPASIYFHCCVELHVPAALLRKLSFTPLSLSRARLRNEMSHRHQQRRIVVFVCLCIQGQYTSVWIWFVGNNYSAVWLHERVVGGLDCQKNTCQVYTSSKNEQCCITFRSKWKVWPQQCPKIYKVKQCGGTRVCAACPGGCWADV